MLDSDGLYERSKLLMLQAGMMKIAIEVARNHGDVPELAVMMQSFANDLDTESHRVWQRADALKQEEIDTARARKNVILLSWHK